MDLLLRQLGRNMATEDQYHPKPRKKVTFIQTQLRVIGTQKMHNLASLPDTASDKCVWEQG